MLGGPSKVPYGTNLLPTGSLQGPLWYTTVSLGVRPKVPYETNCFPWGSLPAP